MGLLSLSYRRPAHVDRNSIPRNSQETSRSEAGESLYSGVSVNSSGIPDALSFDKIVSGGTCPVGHLPPQEITSINN